MDYQTVDNTQEVAFPAMNTLFDGNMCPLTDETATGYTICPQCVVALHSYTTANKACNAISKGSAFPRAMNGSRKPVVVRELR
jgi:hypothetical protein